jgi:hypothetical protein
LENSSVGSNSPQMKIFPACTPISNKGCILWGKFR